MGSAGAGVIVIDAGTGAPDGVIPDVDCAAMVVADLVARGRVGGVLAAGGTRRARSSAGGDPAPQSPRTGRE